MINDEIYRMNLHLHFYHFNVIKERDADTFTVLKTDITKAITLQFAMLAHHLCLKMMYLWQ